MQILLVCFARKSCLTQNFSSRFSGTFFANGKHRHRLFPCIPFPSNFLTKIMSRVFFLDVTKVVRQQLSDIGPLNLWKRNDLLQNCFFYKRTVHSLQYFSCKYFRRKECISSTRQFFSQTSFIFFNGSKSISLIVVVSLFGKKYP